MNFRSIMAIVDGGAESSNVLTTAIELGRRFDAVTTLMQIMPPAAQSIYPVLEAAPTAMIDGLISEIEQSQRDQRSNFDALYEKAVVAAGLPVTSPDEVAKTNHFAIAKETVIGHENREIAERGRLFDLIVIGIPSDESGGVDSAALEAALLDTARPVLIACRYPRPVIGGHVTIAWDGSRESSQSIRNALPLMTAANNVEVVTVAENGVSHANPEDIKKYLRLHGIDATPKTISAARGETAEALINAARENGHALLVMGAYGTSAVAEYMFGGITRAIMEKADIPLLVSH